MMKKSTNLLAMGLALIALLVSCSDMMGDIKGKDKDKTDNAPDRIVSFDSGEAEIPAAPGSITLKSGTQTVGTLPSAPVRPGYVFSGWYTSEDTGGKLFTADTWVGSSMTVHAAWSAGETCAVSFNANGGTGPQSVTVAAGSLLTKPADPVREGYRFAGWFTDDSFTVAWNFETGAVNASMILVARWETWTYTVTFASPGADAAAGPETLGVSSPASTLSALPAPPVRKGYLFGGWFTEEGGAGENFTTATTVTADITVYAAWDTYSYQVTFSAPDATTAPNPAALTVASPAVNAGTIPSAPTRSGFSFAGWWTEENAHGSQFTETTEVTGNLTVHAAWSLVPVYQVSFNSAGGSAVGAQSVASGGFVSEPSEPVRDGYAFGGWYVDQGFNIPWNFATGTVSANLELHARWVSHSYTVTFSNQNATTGPSPAAMTVASPATTLSAFPAAPTRTGYAFAGWWTGTGGTGTQVSLSTPITGNATFYPKWAVTVTFNAPEATTGPSPTAITLASGSTTLGTLPTAPTRTGYTFGGWYTGQNGTGTIFSGSTTVTQSITVYAKWNYDMSSPYWYSYTVTNGTVSLGKGANWPRDLAVLTIPSTLAGYPVTGLSDNAFQSCAGLSSIALPTSLKTIGNYAFSGCRGVGSITIPASVTMIGNSAFSYCSSLSRVTFSGNPQSIGASALSYCTLLDYVTLPDSLTSLGAGVFNECTSLSTLKLPSNLTAIPSNFLYNCANLSSLTIPATVTAIGERAFQGCTGLLSINIPEGITDIPLCAYYACSSLRSITLPSTLKTIGASAFWGCSSLRSVNFPAGLTTITQGAFIGCYNINSITLPATVTSIGSNAFFSNLELKTITIQRSIPPSMGTQVFDDNPNAFQIRVPAAYLSTYKTATNWSAYASRMVGY